MWPPVMGVTRLNSEDVIQKFRDTEALLEGHFVLTSGLAAASTCNALVLQHPREAEAFGAEIAERFRTENIQVVASPAIGVSSLVTKCARVGGEVHLDRARKRSDGFAPRFPISAGERVLVVEDVVTTGGSTRETIAALRANGANLVAAASIIDRSSGKADVGVPRIALATLDVPFS